MQSKNPYEQISPQDEYKAGVNEFDTADSARYKVINDRLRDQTFAIAAKVAPQSSASLAEVADTVTSLPWGWIVTLVAAIAIPLFCLEFWDKGKYTFDGIAVVGSWGNLPNGDLRSVFVPGAPTQLLLKDCKKDHLDMCPNFTALASFQRYAIHPQAYEDALCRLYFRAEAGKPGQPVPIWRIDPARNFCIATNREAIQSDKKQHNAWLLTKLAVGAVVAYAVLIYLNVMLRRKPNGKTPEA